MPAKIENFQLKLLAPRDAPFLIDGHARLEVGGIFPLKDPKSLKKIFIIIETFVHGVNFFLEKRKECSRGIWNVNNRKHLK